MNLELVRIKNNNFIKSKKNNTYTCFSDVSSAGSYDFLSQVIQLNSIEKHHIDELQNKSETRDLSYFNIAKRIIPLFSHEQAHWIDNTSTLWGFEFLEKVYESLSISTSEQINNQSEFNFHNKKSLYNEILCIKYPKYYSTIGTSSGERPWAFQYSMGKLFDVSGRPSEYPIFFTRFSDRIGNLISREPIALCSLFESSATYQEILTEAALLKSILQGDELLVEERLLNEKYISRIYNKDLTEYSVAAHKIAN